MESIKKLTRGGFVLLAAVLATALCVAWAAVAPAKAYAAGINQTAATTSSATIEWADPYEGSSSYETTSYVVRWGEGYEEPNHSQTVPVTQTSFTIPGLKAGTKYNVKIDYTYKSTYSGNEFSSRLYGDVASRVATPTGVKQDKWWHYINKVDFTWNKQSAADKVEYKVCRVSNGKVFKKGSDKYIRNTYEVSGVKNNIMYTVQMRVHDQWGWSGWSKKAYLFTQPMLNAKKTKVSGNKLTVTWNKISGASSYEVYVSTKAKSGYKKVATVKSSKSSATVKKLGKAKFSPKKKYYVYVVAKKGKYDTGLNYIWNVKGSSVSQTYKN